MTETEEEKQVRGCFCGAILTTLVVFFVQWIWPDVIPFDNFEFFYLKGSVKALFVSSIPLLLWAVVINLIVYVWRRQRVLADPGEILVKGLWISGCAGVLEELAFRWIFFYSAIIGLKIVDYILFGLTDWMYTSILCPIANFFTLGLMEHLIYHELGWFVGAAIISTNGKFRDGHQYQGCLGWVNSWFCGMIFFYLTFTYGLFAAMIVHFLFDIVVFGFWALMAVQDRR